MYLSLVLQVLYWFLCIVAVDEQNAQTQQFLENESRSMGSNEKLDNNHTGGSLLADNHTSRSAPSFSVFTAEESYRSQTSSRKIGM